MTPEDQYDLRLLNLSNETGKFAVEVRINNPHWQLALCRAIDSEWIRLVDVTFNLAAAPERLMRVFRLTDAGAKRRDELRLAATPPANVQAV